MLKEDDHSSMVKGAFGVRDLRQPSQELGTWD